MKTAFDASSYTEFLRGKIKENSTIRGFQGKLAAGLGVHGSYLSRVLKEQVHLTPDQAASLCEFLPLQGIEAEYFINLVNLARASSPSLKTILRSQLDELRRRNEDLSRRFTDATKIDEKEKGVYYSAWYFSAIHILLMVPGHDSSKAIARRLKLEEKLVKATLLVLEELGLAQSQGEKWKVRDGNIHLTNTSLWAAIHHSNWRQRAVAKIQEREEGEVRFTGVHAISRTDFQKIKSRLLDSIEEIRKIAGPSPEEELFCVTVDAFRL